MAHAPWRDWHEITKLYVFGELRGHHSDGAAIRVFPSLRELSARFGVARSVLANRSKREGWVAVREQFQAAERERMFALLAQLAVVGSRQSTR